MYHLMFDGIFSNQVLLNDILQVQTTLENIPVELKLTTVSQAFILPYYNGIVPEDCGVSGFIFLPGGHFTIHTFSNRNCYFIDLFSENYFNKRDAIQLINEYLPCKESISNFSTRKDTNTSSYNEIVDKKNIKDDFGLHFLLAIDGYLGTKNMDDLFKVFDSLPSKINMTPIMRPYMIKSEISKNTYISILTMIAESHISLHIINEKLAFFDIFSCSFFNINKVLPQLKDIFIGRNTSEILTVRGSKYRQKFSRN